MNGFKNILVYCKCGTKLVRYKKRGKGRLRKIHRDRITEDFFGIFSGYEANATEIFCPNCQGRIATIRSMQGKFVAKVNQGQLGIIRGGRG
jgi:hypothetical protein